MRIGCYLILLAKSYHRIRKALTYHILRTINYSTKNGIGELVGSLTVTADNQVLDFHTILSVINRRHSWSLILVLQDPIGYHV